MLRASVERAAKVTAQLVEHAGGSDKKVLFHPDLTAFARPKDPAPPPPAEETAIASWWSMTSRWPSFLAKRDPFGGRLRCRYGPVGF